MMADFLWPNPNFDHFKATALVIMANTQKRWMAQGIHLVHITGKYSDHLTPKLCVP